MEGDANMMWHHANFSFISNYLTIVCHFQSCLWTSWPRGLSDIQKLSCDLPNATQFDDQVFMLSSALLWASPAPPTLHHRCNVWKQHDGTFGTCVRALQQIVAMCNVNPLLPWLTCTLTDTLWCSAAAWHSEHVCFALRSCRWLFFFAVVCLCLSN